VTYAALICSEQHIRNIKLLLCKPFLVWYFTIIFC